MREGVGTTARTVDSVAVPARHTRPATEHLGSRVTRVESCDWREKRDFWRGKRDYIVNPAAAHAPVVAFQVRKKPIAALGIVLPRSFVTAHMSTQKTKAKQKESTAAYVLPSLDVKHPETNHTPKLLSTTAAQRTIPGPWRLLESNCPANTLPSL